MPASTLNDPSTLPIGPTLHLSPRRELWLLLTLAGIQFTHILDFMIMMPLGPEFTRIFGLSDAQFGLLVSAYTLSAAVSGLFASTYIDRFDRKKLLLTLYVLFALATLACGLANSYETLMAARIAAGVFGGVLSALSQTIVGDLIPFERRGRAMGVVMTSFSLSTVAGVPAGLFLATHLNWHVPFFGIAAISAVLAVVAALTLPRIDAHLHAADRPSPLRGVWQVLREADHLRAFGLSALLMFGGFTVIPFLTIAMQANAGLTPTEVPYIYLCGGALTLFSARFFGRLTDRWGKVRTFRTMALAVCVPLVTVTLLRHQPLWVVLPVTSLFFILMSGRMIPAMAMLASAAKPSVRGAFMTLNTSVQSAAMGLAALVGGLIISRDAQGMVQFYWAAALLGVGAHCAAVWLSGRINLADAPKPQANH
ncbi:MAG: MFS transporter [Burkholderiaceae bacterium]